MGASNALLAYATYAGKVPPLSLVCLTYMALISLDSDQQPWYGQGHEALAEHALGRTPPITDSDLRAVRRAVQPLLDGGAISVDRRAAPRKDAPSTVRYLLMLRPETPDGFRPANVGRKPSGVRSDDGRTPDGFRPANVGRFPAERRTVSDRTPDGNRPTEEEEEEEETSSSTARRSQPHRQEEEATTREPQTPPADDGQGHDDGAGNEHQAVAADLVSSLPGTLTRGNRTRLSSYVVKAMADGWTVEQLRTELTRDLGSAASRAAVWVTRLKELGEPPVAATSTVAAPLPPMCDDPRHDPLDPNRRLLDDEDRSIGPCPVCSTPRLIGA
ncbi:hypothetical protein [Microbispora sp. CSR-4]|uniref:hypothetical protein n=1 Tax=Microbispora sp. CSR-4 TaxID=2592813 RepID=UPI0011C6FCDD|nr:hypothetical protein [Microbispora sp. CSR-4]